MKMILRYGIAGFALLFLVYGCLTNKDPINAYDTPENLIENPSFENNPSAFFNEFRLDGWKMWSFEDTIHIQLVNDVPPDGGTYALRLKAEWTTSGAVYQRVNVKPGLYYFRFKGKGKTIDDPGVGGAPCGVIQIYVRRNNDIAHSKYEGFPSNRDWTEFTFMDTVAVEQGDSLTVMLRGCFGQFNDGYVLFDDIRLEILKQM